MTVSRSPPTGPDDGQGAIGQAVHLVESTRLEQEGIGKVGIRFHQMSEPVVIGR